MKTKLKVALTFYGQPRYVKNPHILESYRDYYLDRHDCDVFCHLWWGNSNKFDTSSWAVCEGEMISPDSLDYIKEKFKPVAIKHEEPRSFEFDKLALEYIDGNFTGRKHHPQFGDIWSKKNYSNMLSQLYSIQETSRLALDHIEKTGVHYDFVALVRYDTILVDQPDLFLCEQKLHLPCHHDRFPDMIMFYPQKHLNWSANVFDDASNVCYNVDSIAAEQFKYHSFKNRFSLSEIQPARMDAHAVRNPDDDLSKAVCHEHRKKEVWERSKGYYK